VLARSCKESAVAVADAYNISVFDLLHLDNSCFKNVFWDYFTSVALYTPTATMIRHAIGSARRPAPTTLFHIRGRNLATAFSVARPVVWNSLPAAVRHADTLHTFKRRLKSYFF